MQEILEQFPTKWIPVRCQKMRQSIERQRRSESIRSQSAPDWFARFRWAVGWAMLFASFILVPTVNAQEGSRPSPFGVPIAPATTAAPATAGQSPTAAIAQRAPSGLIEQAWNWLLTTQSRLNRDMAAAVRGLKSEHPLGAAMALIAIAFSYGVLHAAGPGHGKAVISSYVLANEETVRRGIVLSFLAAVFQALSAIAFVGILAVALSQTSLQMRSTEATIETISWGLVAAVGAYMLWRQLAPIFASARGNATQPMSATGAASPFAIEHPKAGAHTHGPDCGCGHSHMPAPKDLQGAWSWRKALPIALSVGIRPCSGAILLLIFALSQGMFWAGVVGTFAMALGTAITVSILAAMAVGSRNWAERMSGPGSVWAERVQTGAGVAGAGLVLLLGSAFFIASLRGGSPL